MRREIKSTNNPSYSTSSKKAKLLFVSACSLHLFLVVEPKEKLQLLSAVWLLGRRIPLCRVITASVVLSLVSLSTAGLYQVH